MSDPTALPHTARTTAAARLPLASLYERFDAVASGRRTDAGENLHQVILDRLRTTRTHAEAAGWTACALERDGGSGRLRLIGLAPAAAQRTIVPDWTVGVAADALARVADAPLPQPNVATPPQPRRIVRG